jgi:hypothetical protein
MIWLIQYDIFTAKDVNYISAKMNYFHDWLAVGPSNDRENPQTSPPQRDRIYLIRYGILVSWDLNYKFPTTNKSFRPVARKFKPLCQFSESYRGPPRLSLGSPLIFQRATKTFRRAHTELLTSLPMSRDARRGGTNHRYFEFKRL